MRWHLELCVSERPLLTLRLMEPVWFGRSCSRPNVDAKALRRNLETTTLQRVFSDDVLLFQATGADIRSACRSRMTFTRATVADRSFVWAKRLDVRNRRC